MLQCVECGCWQHWTLRCKYCGERFKTWDVQVDFTDDENKPLMDDWKHAQISK